MTAKMLNTALIAVAGLLAAPAFAAGGVNASGEVGYVPAAPSASVPAGGLTREAVRNEYLVAKRNHQLPPSGEGADIGYRAPQGAGLSREAVQAEAVRALRAGQLTGGEV